MPSVTYLRLDGTIPPVQRHTIVSRFNSDPSIDVLLLTTQVGGLGLNLTGADTVIFVEHDWNPMKDLQAMDRAHRIGQKKVVNVYRLITRATLEEKIMGYVEVVQCLSSGLKFDIFQVAEIQAVDGKHSHQQ
jgi:TATA-binding protein-associated factor